MRSKPTLILVLLAAAACAPRPERLTIEGRTITVYNDSGERWNAVEVWVNDHYRATRDTLAPGERFVMPVDRLQAGFGRRFGANERITGIEVQATDAGGDPVRLTWGNGRRR
jgi:hypothetical protein